MRPPEDDTEAPHSLPSFPRRLEASFKGLQFNIDRYLDPLIPQSRVDRLPRPISRFLGHRDAPNQPIGNVAIAAWSLFGGFVGTAILSGLFMSDFIKNNGGPIIVGSYGAAAILEYNAIESPFSQPRNAIGGQFLAALIGTCITKLFALNPNFDSLRWVAGSLSVGISSGLMVLTGTVHPPAGATALLAAVDSQVSGLGWLYLPIVLLSSFLTTAVACLLNNIHRQYPLYWWSPKKPAPRIADKDEETGQEHPPRQGMHFGTDQTLQRHLQAEVVISTFGVSIPSELSLSTEERNILKIIKERIDRMSIEEDGRVSDVHSDCHTNDEEKSDKSSI